MVPDGTVIWLLVLAAMAVAAVVVLRRMSRLIGRTRELERFQRTVTTLDARFAAAADPLVAALDELRRRAGDPRALAERLPGLSSELRAAAAEARALRPPAALLAPTTGLGRELERAVRATEMVEHGLDAMLAARGSRELEAQVSLKRGALNLRHARGAFRELVASITVVTPADLAAGPSVRSPASPPVVPTYLVDGSETDVDGAFDPRM